MLTPVDIAKIAGRDLVNANILSFDVAMRQYGNLIEYNNPVVQLHVLAQICHESAGFTYDREIWGKGGGTPAQKRYEDRKDLGHSAAVPGEARKFAGHGPIQVTGRANHIEYREWCRKHIDSNAPDFEANPELINTDPWEGLTVIWYWETRNLTSYAKRNDFENVTRRINGGLNGYEDRARYFGRTALVMLGRPLSLVKYQVEKGLLADGIAGPRTREALFSDVEKLPVEPMPAPGVSQTVDKLALITPLLKQINSILEQ